MTRRLRIGVDATPLLGPITGIGSYTANLLSVLRRDWPEDELVATAFSLRGRGALAGVVPRGVCVRSRAAPARVLRLAWQVVDHPPVEALTGRVDVFHATNFVLPPTRRARGVVTIHDLAYLRFPQTVSSASLANRELVPRALARAAVVLTPSATVAQQLMDAYRVERDRVVVTPLGVDQEWAETLAPPADWLAQKGIRSPYILAVGTLEPRKNLSALIAAHHVMLRQSSDPPQLVIVGGAGWGHVLDRGALDDGLVVTTGYLPTSQVRQLVAGAGVLAFPSHDEGFGLPPLEALACGVAVVANDLPVTREVLGDQAAFCDVEDAEAFAAALHTALTDPVGDPASRKAHAARFTWERCARATHTAYERSVA